MAEPQRTARPLRVAWTGPVGPGGGVPAMGLLMLRELLRQGVEVDLYVPTYAWQPAPLPPAPGLRIIEHRSGWRWNRWYSSTKATAMFSGLLVRSLMSILLGLRLLVENRRHPYDAIYQLSQTELFVLGRARRFAPPIVVHPCTHAEGELRWHRAERDYALSSEPRIVHYAVRGLLKLRSRLQPGELSRADVVIGLSRRFNELISADYDIPQDRLRVVYTPVDLDRFSPGAERPAQRPRTLLFISRISTRKGVEEIVQLSHRLADLEGAVRLLVIGGPTQWSDYRRHLAGLNPAVAEYRGHVSSDELPALMQEAAMLLVPSRYEPGSITTAEALACGLPVVLSDEVGNAERASGPHVRVHRAGAVDSLEDAVRSMLAALDEDEPALRLSARRNAELAFGVEGVVSDLISVLEAARDRPAQLRVDAPAQPGAPLAERRVGATAIGAKA